MRILCTVLFAFAKFCGDGWGSLREAQYACSLEIQNNKRMRCGARRLVYIPSYRSTQLLSCMDVVIQPHCTYRRDVDIFATVPMLGSSALLLEGSINAKSPRRLQCMRAACKSGWPHERSDICCCWMFGAKSEGTDRVSSSAPVWSVGQAYFWPTEGLLRGSGALVCAAPRPACRLAS